MQAEHPRKARRILKQTSNIKKLCKQLNQKRTEITATEMKDKIDQILYLAVQVENIVEDVLKGGNWGEGEHGEHGERVGDGWMEKEGDMKKLNGVSGEGKERRSGDGLKRSAGRKGDSDRVGYEFEDSDACSQALETIQRYTRKLDKFEKKMGFLIHQANFSRTRSKSNLLSPPNPPKPPKKPSSSQTPSPSPSPSFPRKNKDKQIRNHISSEAQAQIEIEMQKIDREVAEIVRKIQFQDVVDEVDDEEKQQENYQEL